MRKSKDLVPDLWAYDIEASPDAGSGGCYSDPRSPARIDQYPSPSARGLSVRNGEGNSRSVDILERAFREADLQCEVSSSWRDNDIRSRGTHARRIGSGFCGGAGLKNRLAPRDFRANTAKVRTRKGRNEQCKAGSHDRKWSMVRFRSRANDFFQKWGVRRQYGRCLAILCWLPWACC